MSGNQLSFYTDSENLPQPPEDNKHVLRPSQYCPNNCGWLDALELDGHRVEYTPYWDEYYDEDGNLLKHTLIHEFSLGTTVIHYCPGCGAEIMRSTKVM